MPENPSNLQKFESIICAGLESSHVSVAKRFVDLLNGLSESNGSLSFGESVTQALQKAKPNIPSDGPQVCVQQILYFMVNVFVMLIVFFKDPA